MKHIVVDLEMNKVTDKEIKKDFNNETIEIGAVMLDEKYNEVSSFVVYLKPELNPNITSSISKLTGITDEKVMNAPTFSTAINMFADWCAGTGDEYTVYAWSDNDYYQVTRELEYKSIELTNNISKLIECDWVDFQKEFDDRMGFGRCVSLKMALDLAGVDFEGRQHDGLDDARNTSKLLQIINDKELYSKTLKRTEEALKPKSFGFSLGDLINVAMLGA